jgi:hypothetical protein
MQQQQWSSWVNNGSMWRPLARPTVGVSVIVAVTAARLMAGSKRPWIDPVGSGRPTSVKDINLDTARSDNLSEPAHEPVIMACRYQPSNLGRFQAAIGDTLRSGSA